MLIYFVSSVYRTIYICGFKFVAQIHGQMHHHKMGCMARYIISQNVMHGLMQYFTKWDVWSDVTFHKDLTIFN